MITTKEAAQEGVPAIRVIRLSDKQQTANPIMVNRQVGGHLNQIKSNRLRTPTETAARNDKGSDRITEIEKAA